MAIQMLVIINSFMQSSTSRTAKRLSGSGRIFKNISNVTRRQRFRKAQIMTQADFKPKEGDIWLAETKAYEFKKGKWVEEK